MSTDIIDNSLQLVEYVGKSLDHTGELVKVCQSVKRLNLPKNVTNCHKLVEHDVKSINQVDKFDRSYVTFKLNLWS